MTRSSIIRWAAAAFLCSIVLIFCIGVVWWYHVLWTPANTAETTLEIQPGTASITILRQLKDLGLMPSITAGRLYLEVPARGREMQWGTYIIPPGSRPVDTLEMILLGKVQLLKVTIIEGMNSLEIRDVLGNAGVNGVQDWPSIMQNNQLIGDLAPDASSLEGFLFPDTYSFSTGVTVVDVIHAMLDHFRTVWEEENRAVSPPAMTTLEIVTLASLVEAETGVPQERERVAGVFVNRLRRGMLLQCDPTVVFALKRRGEWDGRLLRIHWNVDDPYNTYRYPGLPPGPINNPGRAALRAALNPENHTLLYFVADDFGGHIFSSTLQQHNRAVLKRKRSRH